MPQSCDKKPWALFVQKTFDGVLFEEEGIISCIQMYLSFRADYNISTWYYNLHLKCKVLISGGKRAY